MPSRRKYDGPCPQHPEKKSNCRHCGAYYMQRRYYGGATPPPEKKLDSFQRRRAIDHGVVIYRELHWPAPQLDRGAQAMR